MVALATLVDMKHFIKIQHQLTKTLWALAAFLVVSTATARPLTVADIGELFVFGISGTEVDSNLESHLKATCPGSVLLFKRNIVSEQQLIAMTSKLSTLHRACSMNPLFIGVDQEGGSVSRIALDPPMPTPWSVGLSDDPSLAENLGVTVGAHLRRLGIHFNLAPVLDLGSSKLDTFIGSRAYGAKAEVVASMGTAFSRGLVRSGVLPVAKHFPGMGIVPNDPHTQMVRRSTSFEQLKRTDMKPFEEFFKIHPSAVMPSHLIYPLADHSGRPGTFSKELLINQLRNKMRFQGLVISDDLLMRGAQESKDLGANVISALVAGNDIVMISWSKSNQQKAIEAVTKALSAGTLSKALVLEKIERIRRHKTAIFNSPRKETTLAYSSTVLELVGKAMRGLDPIYLKSKPKRLFVWPENFRARWQVERALHLPTLGASAIEFKTVQKSDLILAFVRDRKQLRKIEAWPREIRANTIVINQMNPYLPLRGYAGKWDLPIDHPMLAAEVAKKLAAQWSYSISYR